MQDRRRGRIWTELYGKRWGLLALLIPWVRMVLGIRVYDYFDWRAQVLFGTIVAVVWLGFATRSSKSAEATGNAIVSGLLAFWAILLTGWTQIG